MSARQAMVAPFPCAILAGPAAGGTGGHVEEDGT
jgi:hypothetical protein